MASDLNFVEHVCEQVGLGSALSFRKMFGEYALYIDGKVVALICDNQVFVKPTPEGEQILRQVTMASPYPGAKPQFRIDEALDDRDLLKMLFTATARALPVPKAKKPKARAK
ncbi:MAG: TfoX/Sxy family protein [Aquabacterium sp.]|uniref:TfoX/Sxy family protein n=1 Tax=Aquabacterium sp. TaxID=1872578 RepID=UPI003BE19575